MVNYRFNNSKETFTFTRWELHSKYATLETLPQYFISLSFPSLLLRAVWNIHFYLQIAKQEVRFSSLTESFFLGSKNSYLCLISWFFLCQKIRIKSLGKWLVFMTEWLNRSDCIGVADERVASSWNFWSSGKKLSYWCSGVNVKESSGASYVLLSGYLLTCFSLFCVLTKKLIY